LSEPRAIRLGQQDVEYVLKRSAKRRRAVLTVDDSGLTVSVPWRTSDRYIAQLLKDAEAWVLRKLKIWAARKPPQRQWASGELIDFLGRQLRLRLVGRAKTAIVQLRDGNVLELSLPVPEDQQRVRDAVERFLLGSRLPFAVDRGKAAGIHQVLGPFVAHFESIFPEIGGVDELRAAARPVAVIDDAIERDGFARRRSAGVEVVHTHGGASE